jgi:hypothetical protein
VERHRHRWEDNIKMDLREIGIDASYFYFTVEISMLESLAVFCKS